jgi:uncharacterized protein (DUF433 family)
MTFSTDHKYIHIAESGTPFITGSTMKLVELITSVRAYGWSPEQLKDNYPHLSMSQIYSAMAYYWDHKPEVDAEVNRLDQWSAQMRQASGESNISQKLREQGLL